MLVFSAYWGLVNNTKLSQFYYGVACNLADEVFYSFIKYKFIFYYIYFILIFIIDTRAIVKRKCWSINKIKESFRKSILFLQTKRTSIFLKF